jgi:inosine/xanthosine triphosphate pyrophosphatase family protein
MTCPNVSDIKLYTSSATKLREYRALAPSDLTIEQGDDLREVMADAETVIIHKALTGGEGRLVEDTILVVDGEPWVDVKWKIPALLRDETAAGITLVWQVRLGVMWRGHIYTFLGETHGVVCPFTVAGAGMDPIFWIPEARASLSQLDVMGQKEGHSARKRALHNLMNKKVHTITPVDSVLPWTGSYQNE